MLKARIYGMYMYMVIYLVMYKKRSELQIIPNYLDRVQI